MSKIYFHNIAEEADVYGPERAHFGITISRFTWGFLEGLAWDSPGKPSPLRACFPPSHHLLSSDNFERHVATTLKAGLFADKLILHGRPVELFGLQLNTALDLGNDVLKLAARLHGQCELHAYVEGPNRAWLADIIEQGRRIEFLRPNMGWESVVTMLRSADDSPVVTSYSVTEQFPNPGIANWSPPLYDDGEENWDAWHDLPDGEQWAMALAGLRDKSRYSSWLEMTPATWDNFTFNDGMNICEFIEELLHPPITT